MRAVDETDDAGEVRQRGAPHGITLFDHAAIAAELAEGDRPYAEVLIDAFSSVTQTVDTSTATTSTSSGTGISVGGALGAELELSDTFSLELAVRYDHVVSNGADGPRGGLLGVLGGGTFYF